MPEWSFIDYNLWRNYGEQTVKLLTVFGDLDDTDLFFFFLSLSIAVGQFPFRDASLEADVEFAQNVIKTIRSIRADYMLTPKMKIEGESWPLDLPLAYVWMDFPATTSPSPTQPLYCTFGFVYLKMI